MLRTFDGDKHKLGNAEKFLLQLIEVPKLVLNLKFNIVVCSNYSLNI